MTNSDRKFFLFLFFMFESALFLAATLFHFFGGFIALISFFIVCFVVGFFYLYITYRNERDEELGIDKSSKWKRKLKKKENNGVLKGEQIIRIHRDVIISENVLTMNLDKFTYTRSTLKMMILIISLFFYIVIIMTINNLIYFWLKELSPEFYDSLMLFIFPNIIAGGLFLGYYIYNLLYGNKIREIRWEIDKKKETITYFYVVNSKARKKKELGLNDVESILNEKTVRKNVNSGTLIKEFDLYFILRNGKKVKICSPPFEGSSERLSMELSSFLNLEVKTKIYNISLKNVLNQDLIITSKEENRENNKAQNKPWETPKMKYCKGCSKLIISSALYCNYCGVKQ